MQVRIRKAGAVLLAACVTLTGAKQLHAQTTTLPEGLREVVHRNAPFIVHETFNSVDPVGGSDHMLRVDFDGTTFGPGKAATAASRTASVDRTAVAYFSVVESGYSSDKGYFFLGYYWYHPRDNGADFVDPFGIGRSDPGHEHDMEGAILLVKKSAYFPYGSPIDVLTQAHGELIPYITQQTVIPNNTATGSPAYGYVSFWYDARNGFQRPVIAVRGRNHGTHVPQPCTPGGSQYAGPDLNYGIYGNTQNGTVYQACIHDGYQWLLYAPVNPFETGQVLSIDYRQGWAWYQLNELFTSPIWTARMQNQQLFAGTAVNLVNGGAAWDAYHSYIDPNQANPPWQWQGGGGCQNHIGGAYCWYSFGVDGTASYNEPTHWPVSPSYGRLLTDPAAEMGMRFTSLPDLGEPYRYNPYVTSPPNYYASGPPLSVGISGPNTVPPRSSEEWTALPTGGTAPYSYQWSGALSGTSQTVRGVVASSQPLYLDVWDSAGAHIFTSIYVTVDQCLDPKNPC